MDPKSVAPQFRHDEAPTTAPAHDGPPPPPNDTAGNPRPDGGTVNRPSGVSGDVDELGTQGESRSRNKRPRTVDEKNEGDDDDDNGGVTNGADSSPLPSNTRAVTPFGAAKGPNESTPTVITPAALQALWERGDRIKHVVASLGGGWDFRTVSNETRSAPAGGGGGGRGATVPPQGEIGTPSLTSTDPPMHSHWVVAQVAREKTEEVLLLRRQLAQAQAQISALDAANDAVRDANGQLQTRFDKTAHALRIAGQNATKARNDAAHAEAMASKLAESLQSFQNAMKETSDSMQALREDHQQVSERAREVEMKLVQALAQEATLTSKCRQLETRTCVAEAKLDETRKAVLAWRGRYEVSQESLHDLQVQLDRARDLDEVRRAHAENLSKELRQTTALLEASARTNQASEDAVRQLQEANRNLNEQVESQSTELSECRLKSQRDKERLNESYSKALTKLQQTEIQLELHKNSVAAKEDEWKQERKRLLSALNASKGAPKETPAPAAAGAGADTSKHADSALTSVSSRLPKLASMGSSRSTNSTNASGVAVVASDQVPRMNLPALGTVAAPVTGSTCCFCSKPATYGVIKACQCGRQQCFKRAHAACASKHSSASGDGSDPRLILCGAADGARGSNDVRTAGGSSSNAGNRLNESSAASSAP